MAIAFGSATGVSPLATGWRHVAVVLPARRRKEGLDVIDFDDIRTRVPLSSFCESRGMRLKRDGASGRLKTRCPLHQEKHPSFTIWPDGYFYCYGCGANGDVTQLCATLDGISSADAARKLGAGERLFPSAAIIKPVEPTKPQPYQLSVQDQQRMARAAHRLAADLVLIDKLTDRRPEWTAETIRGVALEGDLGYEAGRILFGYSNGIKARWKDSAGDRVIRWLVGSAASECWRQSLLVSSTQGVFFAEGESDALTLISLGLEIPGQSLVVGLAGANLLPDPLPFAGKDIVIVPDPDLAGQTSAQKLRALLAPLARSIKTIDLRRAQNG